MNRLALPRLPSDLLGLLSPDERAASVGGEVDAFTWTCATGRMLRSPGTSPSALQVVKHATAAISDEHLLSDLRARCDVEIAELIRVAETLRTAAPLEGAAAWMTLSWRDDLESVVTALGFAARHASSPPQEPSDRLDALETFLVERLRDVDVAFDDLDGPLLHALRINPNNHVRQRLDAVADDPSVGFWIALSQRVSPSAAVLESLRRPEPRHGSPSVPIASAFREGLRVPSAAGGTDLLEAFQEVDVEPIAALANGQVAIRIRAPMTSEDASATLSGLAISSVPSELLQDAWAESGTVRVDSTEVRHVGRWISFADLKGAEKWTLSAKLKDGTIDSVALDFAADKG